jgi:hypothetical protein
MIDHGVVHSQTIGRLNKSETVAFGYLCARFEQRVTRTFGYPLHAPSFITAGNGLADEKSEGPLLVPDEMRKRSLLR